MRSIASSCSMMLSGTRDGDGSGIGESLAEISGSLGCLLGCLLGCPLAWREVNVERVIVSIEWKFEYTVKFMLERDVGVVRMFGVVGCSGVSEVVRCSDGLWLQLRCCAHNRYGPLFQSIGVVGDERR